MTNIYFPDEKITFNDLYFVCYMIERTARHVKQHNRYVVERIGREALAHQLSIAQTNHCLNPEQVVADWVSQYRIERGNVDMTRVNPQYTDRYPTPLQMGKVYARLIDSVTPDDGNYVDTTLKVYASPICEKLDDYNCSAYYEPSYVQRQAYYDGHF